MKKIYVYFFFENHIFITNIVYKSWNKKIKKSNNEYNFRNIKPNHITRVTGFLLLLYG